MSTLSPLFPLPASVRAGLRGLSLRPRRGRGVRGLGLHASRQQGEGLEFSQYRGYQPGDEPRRVDWKLYARAEKLFVRQSEREAPLTIWLLLDATASMAQADAGSAPQRRWDVACQLVACITELAIAQGDALGLAVVNENGLQLLPATPALRQRDALALQLARSTPNGQWPERDVLGPLLARIGREDLLIAISDGFEAQLTGALERLSASGRDTWLAQLLTASERDFPFTAGHRFVDPETGAELPGHGPALRAGFLQRFAAAQSALHGRLHAAGVHVATGHTDEPATAVLRRLCAHRGAAR